MTCLGWSTRQTCAGRTNVNITPDTAANPSTQSCPDVTWFWAIAAAILGFGLTKNN